MLQPLLLGYLSSFTYGEASIDYRRDSNRASVIKEKDKRVDEAALVRNCLQLLETSMISEALIERLRVLGFDRAATFMIPHCPILGGKSA
jgi:hypothetical protein